MNMFSRNLSIVGNSQTYVLKIAPIQLSPARRKLPINQPKDLMMASTREEAKYYLASYIARREGGYLNATGSIGYFVDKLTRKKMRVYIKRRRSVSLD